jgi:hypothetical protein
MLYMARRVASQTPVCYCYTKAVFNKDPLVHLLYIGEFEEDGYYYATL